MMFPEVPSNPMDGATARSVPGRQRAGNTHLLTQVGYSLVTNSGRQKPPRRHRSEYTIHWPELWSVENTAAAKDKSFVLAVDATACAKPTAKFAAVAITSVSLRRQLRTGLLSHEQQPQSRRQAGDLALSVCLTLQQVVPEKRQSVDVCEVTAIVGQWETADAKKESKGSSQTTGFPQLSLGGTTATPSSDEPSRATAIGETHAF